jgi:YD repeat-containing protein
MLSQIQINRRLDTAYIALRPDLPPGSVARSDRIHDDLVLDYDAAGRLVGIELLDASQYMNLDKTSQQTADLLWGVAEAAAFAGVKRSNFVRDYANKSDFPKPLVQLASGRLWLSKDITDYIKTKKGLQSISSSEERKDSLPAQKAGTSPGRKVSRSSGTQRSEITGDHRVSGGKRKR